MQFSNPTLILKSFPTDHDGKIERSARIMLSVNVPRDFTPCAHQRDRLRRVVFGTYQISPDLTVHTVFGTYASVRSQVINDDFRSTIAASAVVQHVQVSSEFVQVECDRRLNETTIVECLKNEHESKQNTSRPPTPLYSSNVSNVFFFFFL